jgi:hypothetical protein
MMKRIRKNPKNGLKLRNMIQTEMILSIIELTEVLTAIMMAILEMATVAMKKMS